MAQPDDDRECGGTLKFSAEAKEKLARLEYLANFFIEEAKLITERAVLDPEDDLARREYLVNCLGETLKLRAATEEEIAWAKSAAYILVGVPNSFAKSSAEAKEKLARAEEHYNAGVEKFCEEHDVRATHAVLKEFEKLRAVLVWAEEHSAILAKAPNLSAIEEYLAWAKERVNCLGETLKLRAPTEEEIAWANKANECRDELLSMKEYSARLEQFINICTGAPELRTEAEENLARVLRALAKQRDTWLTTRDGASAGGKARAELHRPEHAKWQKFATEIRAAKPGLNKTEVARGVKRRLGLDCSVANIMRYIRL